jgi:AcrR family transcriptional regulator
MLTEVERWSPAAIRILSATAKLVALRGYSVTSTRDIAAAVGVQQPAIYKYFSTKDDILVALVRLAVERPLELVEMLATLRLPAAVKLHRLLKDCPVHLCSLSYVLATILTTPEPQQDRFAEGRT